MQIGKNQDIENRTKSKAHNTNSIFQKSWWLDAVAPHQWDCLVVKNDAEEVKARMPYVLTRKLGMNMIIMPPLTQTLGPWLVPSTAKYAMQLSRQKDLMNSLIEQLPPFDFFSQHLHYSITNWLPFYWAGFSQTTRYTYVLHALEDLDKIWAGTMHNIRTDIRKAEKQLLVRTDLGIERFLDVNLMTFQRQGRQLPYSYGLVQRLDAACVDHEARRIFFAEDAKGQIHAAVYIVWDENSAYYLMGGGNPELRNSGAHSLLIWEAIKFASKVTGKFDFEGSMVESVERFCRAFGAQQMAFSQITKSSKRMEIMRFGKRFLKGFRDH